MCDKSLLNFDPIMILKATSILGILNEDMDPPYSITLHA
jgi:hypothetical protein